MRQCHLDEVTLHGGREGLGGDEPNPLLATGSFERGAAEVVELSLTPASGAGRIQLDDLGAGVLILAARSSDGDIESSQVTFRVQDLDGLRPGQILTDDARVSRQQQLRDSCT